MNVEFIEALKQIEKEKGISGEVLIEAVETALATAYKKEYAGSQNIRVKMDPADGSMKVFARYTVLEEVVDPRLEISLAEAQKINPNFQPDDIYETELPAKDLGRIAAQNAKQIVIQRIREAERNMVFEEFANREGDIVTGMVQRYEHKNVYIELGKAEAVLPTSEQIPNERYEQGMRVKTYLLEVKKATKGPQITVSRTHPGLLKRLFELEVPEIYDGTVEIKTVAREPGARSKIAVYSRDKNVDPVGSCVGAKGSRVQNIVRELKGERIDIIPWNEDVKLFIANSLSPAKVSEVCLSWDSKNAIVIVPDDQLSLGIGKEGQNARLAAKLTNWKIDIKNETQAEEIADQLDELRRKEEERKQPEEQGQAAMQPKKKQKGQVETEAEPSEEYNGEPIPTEEVEDWSTSKKKKRKKDAEPDSSQAIDTILAKPVKKKAKKREKFFDEDELLQDLVEDHQSKHVDDAVNVVYTEGNEKDNFGVSLGDIFKNLKGFNISEGNNEQTGETKAKKTTKPKKKKEE